MRPLIVARRGDARMDRHRARSEATQSHSAPLGRFASLAMTAALVLLCAVPASAADKRFPDWPCKQVKVPELSLASVWSGESIDAGGAAWKQDPKLLDLVPLLAARRTEIEAAEAAIARYAAELPAAERKPALLTLFAALFDTLNTQRAEVMNGIERFSRKQKALAEKVRGDTRAMQEARDKSDADQVKLDAQANSIEWDLRVFDDRQKSLSAVCEAPVLIEQRLGALGKAIQKAMQ